MKVFAHDLENEVDLAIEHVALANLGQLRDVLFEFAQIGLGLALEADHGEYGNGKAQLRRVEIGVIAAYDPVLFKPSHAAQTRRRCQPDTLRQFHVRHAALRLQFTQQTAVDLVKIGHGASNFPVI